MTKPSKTAEPTAIGARITWMQHADAITVVIAQHVPPRTWWAIASWYLCWWIAGAGMAYGWGIASTPDERMFLAICLAFWAFFAVRIGKVLVWRKIGRETLRIRAGELTYKRAWGTWGKAYLYELEAISKLEVVERDPRKLFHVLDIEPWIIGGEALHMRHRGRSVSFGLQLGTRDARALASVLDRAISTYR